MPSAINSVAQRDPTRTLTLRNQFAREMRVRWATVARDVRISILERDCFGLGIANPTTNAPTAPRQFEFATIPERLELFMAWLAALEEEAILSVRPGGRIVEPGAHWTNAYVRDAYLRGVNSARAKLEQAGYTPEQIGTLPGTSATAEVLGASWHADRIAMLYSRTFEDLKTVTAVSDAAVRRAMADGLRLHLSEGLAQGVNPRTIARNMVADATHHLDTIGRSRAEMIARTEVIRAHHVANIAEFSRVDANLRVRVLAEILNGPAPCPICVQLAAQGPYTLIYAEGLIPAHPHCVCAVSPEVRTETGRRDEMLVAA